MLCSSQWLQLFSGRWRSWHILPGRAALPLCWGNPADLYHRPYEDWTLPTGELLQTLFLVRDRWDLCFTFFSNISDLFTFRFVLTSLCVSLPPSPVKPDKVKIGKVNTTVVQWSYPSSWSRPYSYFPLTFQITQLGSRCRKCNNLCIDSNPSKVRGTSRLWGSLYKKN